MIFDRNPRARDYKVSQLVAAIRASLESNWQPYDHIAKLQKQWRQTPEQKQWSQTPETMEPNADSQKYRSHAPNFKKWSRAPAV